LVAQQNGSAVSDRDTSGRADQVRAGDMTMPSS